MLGFRKAANQAVSKSSTAAANVGNQLSDAGKTAYGYAMNHPKASAAVLLGTGVAAGLLWLVQRNGGFRTTYEQTLRRVRRQPRSRAQRAAAR